MQAEWVVVRAYKTLLEALLGTSEAAEAQRTVEYLLCYVSVEHHGRVPRCTRTVHLLV